MRHYIQHRKKKGRKIWLIPTLIILAVLVVMYFRNKDSLIVNDHPVIVATSTKPVKPNVTKPQVKGEMSISVYPENIMQGEPAIIKVNGLSSTTNVKSFTFDNRPLIFFLYEDEVSAFLGVDLNYATGTFPLVLTMKDGRQITKDFVINARPPLRIPFDIPDKLGGNTPQSIKTLFTTLAQEAKIVNAIPTGYTRLWTEKFRSPLNTPIVVEDPYGYTRITGNSTMPHKGTDMKAPLGTPIYAMNRGKIKFTNNLRNYGNTVVIDHGLGLQTVYMHLSEIKVTNDQMVEKGDLIALSGDSGYTLNPHLHLTVRIWDVSIDAMKFLELLGE